MQIRTTMTVMQNQRYLAGYHKGWIRYLTLSYLLYTIYSISYFLLSISYFLCLNLSLSYPVESMYTTIRCLFLQYSRFFYVVPCSFILQHTYLLHPYDIRLHVLKKPQNTIPECSFRYYFFPCAGTENIWFSCRAIHCL